MRARETTPVPGGHVLYWAFVAVLIGVAAYEVGLRWGLLVLVAVAVVLAPARRRRSTR